jgi:hypothetical protein
MFVRNVVSNTSGVCREDLFAVIEQNAGVVHQHIEPIACSRKFFCCAPNALWFRDVDLQSGDCFAASIFGGAFFFSFAVKPLRRSLASLFVPGAEENMKTFARQLPRNFKPDPFVRASHERDPSFFCHSTDSRTPRGKAKAQAGNTPARPFVEVKRRSEYPT